jgi:hypothetical protein
MGLTVRERGEIVATFRHIQVHLMETLAAWVPTTPEMEVKLLFGAHIWDVAQHADAFGKRVHELRMPLQHSLRPSEAYVAVLTELSAATETGQRVAGFYDMVLPALASRYRHYLARTDALMDAPTVRILERCLTDQARMMRESQELREQVSLVIDQGWVQGLAERESAIEDFVRHEAAGF